ncbi:hypothetical protein TNCV_2712411, partial [Trichonephila clavipes]
CFDGKGGEHPPPLGRVRMSLSKFRVHQDATGKQNSASTEKGDERPTSRFHGRMSLPAFHVHQDTMLLFFIHN